MSAPSTHGDQIDGELKWQVAPQGASGVLCGPLLNYKRLSSEEKITWHGSVLIVTTPGYSASDLRLKPASRTQDAAQTADERTFQPVRLYEDEKAVFWRYLLQVPLGSAAANWEYTIPGLTHVFPDKSKFLAPRNFHVPAETESMRMMFHSCNGFSVGTDEEAWSGTALWHDVLRKHEKRPIHVMIGGGDQIYNDGIRVDGPLRPWCDIANPVKRREHPFPESLRADCDRFYLANYVKWYSDDTFGVANGNIAQINIWDDHDIIDGFGSYTDHFMKCPVFRGIGGVAHKYYLLFQHHVPPPPSTFTTDAKGTLHGPAEASSDPQQAQSTYVLKEENEDPSYIIGRTPGPYVEEKSRSIYTRLGAQIAFMGIDARTERTRHQINYNETYDMLFSHASEQLAAAKGQIKHFILLLGVPIAYPRLQWLENLFQSPVGAGLRFLNKRFGVAGGLFNNFDGNIDLMDDLDDHYTAHQHKKERRDLIHRAQNLAQKHSVRVTILGGDVHLAAFGRFYSRPDLDVPAEEDHRFITNVISSAITNHPPPAAVANLLARRNKIHHLDRETDETLLNLFDHNPGRDPETGEMAKDKEGKEVAAKTAASNHCTMPSRNYALLTLSRNMAENAEATHAAVSSGDWSGKDRAHHNMSRKKGNPRDAQHAGEDKAGIHHPAALDQPTGLGGPWGLDVTFSVEIDHGNKDGPTTAYGLTIPGLAARQNAPHATGKASAAGDDIKAEAEKARQNV